MVKKSYDHQELVNDHSYEPMSVQENKDGRYSPLN